MKTLIRAKKNLFNAGQCFTKDKVYEIPKQIKDEYSLFDIQITNDLGEPHLIGSFWRDFEIIN